MRPFLLANWQALFNLIAGIASVLGLFFSYVAWRRAAGAEQAASQAREAVRESNASEDVSRLGERAQELLACAQSDQYEAALVRSRDLLSGLAQARQRWEAYLSDESKERTEKVAKEIGRISRALSAGKPAITPQVREKLLKSCHNVSRLIAEEVGKMLRRLEARNLQ